MISKKRHLIWGGVFIAIVSLLVAAPFGSTTMVKEAMAKSEWVWSKENPKPVWWTWGKEYWPEKPVRGGIYKLAAPRYIGLMNPNHWSVNDWNACVRSGGVEH